MFAKVIQKSREVLLQGFLELSDEEKQEVVKSVNIHDDTLLFACAEYDDVTFAKVLIEYNIPIDHKNADGDTALDFAIRKGSCTILKYLLEKDGGYIACDVVSRAFQYKNIEVVKIVVDHYLSHRTPRKQVTALTAGIGITTSIPQKQKTNYKSKSSYEPLFFLCVDCFFEYETIDFLLSRSVDINETMLEHNVYTNACNRLTRREPATIAIIQEMRDTLEKILYMLKHGLAADSLWYILAAVCELTYHEIHFESGKVYEKLPTRSTFPTDFSPNISADSNFADILDDPLFQEKSERDISYLRRVLEYYQLYFDSESHSYLILGYHYIRYDIVKLLVEHGAIVNHPNLFPVPLLKYVSSNLLNYKYIYSNRRECNMKIFNLLMYCGLHRHYKHPLITEYFANLTLFDLLYLHAFLEVKETRHTFCYSLVDTINSRKFD